MMFLSFSWRNVEINRNCGKDMEQAYYRGQQTLTSGSYYLSTWIVSASVMNAENQ